MRHGNLQALTVLIVSAIAVSCGSGVDQKKFDALYRAGKAVEIDIDNSSAVQVAHSERLPNQFRTEISLLQGRTNGKAEADALPAYEMAAAAYKSFLEGFGASRPLA
jgi:hypothetical protein